MALMTAAAIQFYVTDHLAQIGGLLRINQFLAFHVEAVTLLGVVSSRCGGMMPL